MSNRAKWRNYSKDELQAIINDCISFREVAKKLGYKLDGGGTIQSLHRMVDELSLDISHFLHQGWNKNNIDLTALTVDSNKKNGKTLLNTVLKAKNIPRQCEMCHNDMWLNQPITLQVHHINGIHTDNRLENLQVLCPNCHSLTNSWCKRMKYRNTGQH